MYLTVVLTYESTVKPMLIYTVVVGGKTIKEKTANGALENMKELMQRRQLR